MSAVGVIWHDLECGSYAEDLPLWRALASRTGGPVLDIGAGTGRVALHLARAGHTVTALDRDPELLGALRGRAGEVRVRTVVADARNFSLGERFPLCLVPMQTIQLLDGPSERVACLERIAAHLAPGGLAALAISEALEPFSPVAGIELPLPDQRELDGVVYSSQPTAVRPQGDTFVLERRREVVEADGAHRVAEDAVALHVLDASTLEAEGRRAGLSLRGREPIASTEEYVGSTVVMFGG